MTRSSSRYPTELELEILKILWDGGPFPVREVRERLAAVRDLAYTSVMTTMNIMVRKGYLKRTKSGNSFTYRPAVTRERIERAMLSDLVDRLFEGSPGAAVLHLLETSDLDATELKRVRALLREHGKGEA